MNEIFAVIYETWFGIFDPNYSLIFSTLYDTGSYTKFGLIFIIIPLVCWLLFYYIWKYPYGKLWHWLTCFLITIIIGASVTYGIARTEIFASNNQALNDLIADSSTGYDLYANSLPIKYAIVNGLLTFLIGLLFSIVMKQFSKIQMHLPI